MILLLINYKKNRLFIAKLALTSEASTWSGSSGDPKAAVETGAAFATSSI